MDIAETTRLCRAIASIKPAQAFDEETPAFWSVLLADVSYTDARQAMLNLAVKIRFIGPDDLIAEVKRMRAERLEHVDRILPAADPDDPIAYRRAVLELRRQVADGAITPPPAIDAPQDPRLQVSIPGTFPHPPRPLSITAEGGEKPPAKAAPTLREPTPAERAAEEAEKARQLAALARQVAAESPDREQETA